MKMKTLDLVLKHKWYDMIESGEKTEEYREIKPYWIRRINSVGERISHVRFRKGYSKTSMMFRIDKVIATFGRPEWGAPKGRVVYVIKLGERIN